MGGFDLLAIVGTTTSLVSLILQLKEKSLEKRRELFSSSEKLLEKAHESFDAKWLEESDRNALRRMPHAVYYAIGRKLLDLEEGAAELVLDPEATAEEIDFVVEEMKSEVCRLLTIMKKINAGRLPHRNLDSMWVKYSCSGLAAQREVK